MMKYQMLSALVLGLVMRWSATGPSGVARTFVGHLARAQFLCRARARLRRHGIPDLSLLDFVANASLARKKT